MKKTLVYKLIKVVPLLGLTIGACAGCTVVDNKEDILNYMNEVYKQEFVVESYSPWNKITNTYGGGKIIAYPEGRPELMFCAGMINSKSGGYYDNYKETTWGVEIKQYLDGKISSIISSPFDFSIHIDLGKLDNKDEFQTMSLEEIIKQGRDNIHISMVLAIEPGLRGNNLDYYEEVLSVYSLLKDFKVDEVALSVGFVKNINSNSVKSYLLSTGLHDNDWEDLGSEVYGTMVVSRKSDIENANEISNKYKSGVNK